MIETLQKERQIILRIISGCILLQMWTTQPLWWSGERSFPTLPFFSFIPVINNYLFSELLPWLFVISLLILLIFPKLKQAICGALAIAICLIFLDVNRLQIWMYQWICMLIVLFFSTEKEQWKPLFQFMLIALYCWSGLNKLTIPYLDHSFPWLMNAFECSSTLGESTTLAISSALLEISIGIGFFFRKTRLFALGSAVVMHLIILLILGPFGHDFNQAVWPWNLAMIPLVILVFYQSHFKGFSSLWKTNHTAKVIIVLWGIMPLGNNFGLWDEQLSFKMYSGTNPEGILADASNDKNCFPDSIKVYYTRGSNDGVSNETNVPEERILIDDWALQEMGVPPYISERTLRQTGREWCSCLAEPELATVEIFQVWRWSKEERESIIWKCTALLR